MDRPHPFATGLFLCCLATLATACRAPSVPPPAPAPAQSIAGSPLARTELYFGLSRPGGPDITDAEWQSFRDAEITPRFPAGLTVLHAAGQWRNSDGLIVSEPTRVLILFYERSPEADAHVEAIRARYRERFHQESVLRADSVESVRF